MLKNIKQIIYTTANFKDGWLWFKRIFIFLILTFLVIGFEWNSEYNLGLKILFLFACFLIIISMPIEDVELDEKHLVFKKRSLFSFLNRIKKYEISRIENVRCGGSHYAQLRPSDLIDSGKHNFIQIFFIDKTSTIINTKIYREDLNLLTLKLTPLINNK